MKDEIKRHINPNKNGAFWFGTLGGAMGTPVNAVLLLKHVQQDLTSLLFFEEFTKPVPLTFFS